jgi:predicted RNA-binding protein YlxR (DUF448 family)
MAGKHIPQRTCVSCRQVQGKRQSHQQMGIVSSHQATGIVPLIRVVRAANGQVSVDPTGKQPGRGAYVHASPECWQLALAGGRLAHALKVPQIGEADRAELQAFAAALPNDNESATGRRD